MKLEKIVLRQIRMPLEHFFETSFGRTTERHMVLVEAVGEGASGWGEVTAGENPFYNEEWTASAWQILRDYAAPLVLGRELKCAAEVSGLTGRIRGHLMARGGLEVAVWDLEARLAGQPLWKQIGGGARKEIPCGVSIGIQDSVPQLLEKIERELAAGYQRIKMKIKPGWDVDVVAEVRERFPSIKLMADANSAYTLADADRLKQLDRFYLMMIEQPLAHDEIIDHAALQARLDTPICLDECIRSAHHAEQAIRLPSRRSGCALAGSSISSSAAWADSPKRGAFTTWRRRRAFPCGAAACSKRAWAARTISRSRRCPTSRSPETFRRASVTGRATSSRQPWRPHRAARSWFGTSRASATSWTVTSSARSR